MAYDAELIPPHQMPVIEAVSDEERGDLDFKVAENLEEFRMVEVESIIEGHREPRVF
jgi:hypothetical protein